MKAIAFHPEARAEADAAAAYYWQESPDAATGFRIELIKAAADAQQAPQRWPFEQGTNAQRRRLFRFPFILFYEEHLNEIFILAVAHTSQRPGYWKSRMTP